VIGGGGKGGKSQDNLLRSGNFHGRRVSCFAGEEKQGLVEQGLSRKRERERIFQISEEAKRCRERIIGYYLSEREFG